ncbi:MAG: alanine racemase, partial [Selenomonadaceae bacterium]|nr:alanine racemase [Selenomonadaceae bacterium]
MVIRDVFVEIDLNAIRHNLTEIRRRVKSKLCTVVKANAYGHGAVQVAQVAVECGTDFLAVATVAE